MSDITLSKAVRTNLLSLQSTAEMMTKTQERLATGKKVNSALDNPTNFFTASALNSRAGDLNALIDGMANGIKTIEAADNGLKSITKTLESMQSTLRQARQDKTFQTQSFTINPADIDLTAVQNLQLSGGAIGTTPVNVALNTVTGGAVTPTTLAGTGASFGTVTSGNISVNGANVAIRGNQVASATTLTGGVTNFSSFAGGTFSINGSSVTVPGNSPATPTTMSGTESTFASYAGGTVNINGTDYTLTGNSPATPSTITGGTNFANITSGTAGSITIDVGGTAQSVTLDDGEDIDAVLTKLNGTSLGTIFSKNGTNNGFNVSVAGGQTVTLTNTAGNNNDTLAQIGFASGNRASTDGQVAVTQTATSIAAQINGFNITGLTANDTGGTVNLSLASGEDITISGAAASATFGTATGSTNGSPAVTQTAASIKTIIDNANITGLTVNTTGGSVNLSLASGEDIAITGAGAAAVFGANVNSTNGTEAFTATATTVKADIDAATITGLTVTDTGGQLGFSLASGNDLTLTGDTARLGALGFAAGARTSTNGNAGTPAAVKTVDQLVAAISADTNLTGKIRASNDNGKLRIENLSTQDLDITGFNTTTARVDGGAGTTKIGGNSVRSGLADQFNELRDQLNKLSDDASFNGINLLRGDRLSITFNETGTSSMQIGAVSQTGLNTTSLNIDEVVASGLDSDGSIDTLLNDIKSALGEVRAQSSAFGSNLSIVQNRSEFTKSMINTLETGAANLVLADMNEEAANLLALQTRQQLSSSSLSLASQADQSVLQLLR